MSQPNNTYDTLLFIQIILDRGADELGPPKVYDNDIVQFFQGPSGKRVAIITSIDFMSKEDVAYTLDALGMYSLFSAIFP